MTTLLNPKGRRRRRRMPPRNSKGRFTKRASSSRPHRKRSHRRRRHAAVAIVTIGGRRHRAHRVGRRRSHSRAVFSRRRTRRNPSGLFGKLTRSLGPLNGVVALGIDAGGNALAAHGAEGLRRVLKRFNLTKPIYRLDSRWFYPIELALAGVVSYLGAWAAGKWVSAKVGRAAMRVPTMAFTFALYHGSKPEVDRMFASAGLLEGWAVREDLGKLGDYVRGGSDQLRVRALAAPAAFDPMRATRRSSFASGRSALSLATGQPYAKAG